MYVIGRFIMNTKTTYAGVTTELSDNLFEKPKVYKNKPRKSNKFGAMSLYYDGVYYFPSDIKESDKREGKPFEIQGVYYRGKWYQDTFYITNEFREFLLNALFGLYKLNDPLIVGLYEKLLKECNSQSAK